MAVRQIAAAVLALALGACSSGAAISATAPPPTVRSAAATAAPAVTAGATTAPAASPAASAASGKVSANGATIAQLTAAFQAAGIPQADRWAREVDEYRPYAASDTGFSKLRGQLAKYNPSADVVAKITAALSLP